MQPTNNPWNSLEVVKLIVGILTPFSVGAFGWFISRRLKRLELSQWANQKLIEKRLAIYDSAAPLLNQLLCFYTWVGHWKDVSPEDVIKAKRELDKIFNIYRHLFNDDIYQAYQSFIHALFETFAAPGRDAKIRSHIQGFDGDRTSHCSYTWNPEWSQNFSNGNVVEKKEVRAQYFRLMNALSGSLGAEK
ncbi:hypothetical protein [Paraburkholderia sp. UCT2]|uniref:hypothetical protein n=1 Tax=Paraburkholderia sp. UCT2 TaxID=2615208 RepID=UPI0016550A3A|nr:hypothetical protein [Paraburkholderia sp. UCT2]MBC8732614.1 hypothetical protein [Paraburkholderia sp. UCT2]